jgi:hypothetical protein
MPLRHSHTFAIGTPSTFNTGPPQALSIFSIEFWLDEARRLDLTPMYELTPTGACIRQAATRH